jgi:hypothetical protein
VRPAPERASEIPPMKEAERKQRGEKSAVIVERLVRVQLRAMSCERFNPGIRCEPDEMILREGRAGNQMAAPRERQGLAYLYPACGTHSLSLIDDLTADAIERMRAEGFEPAVPITSRHG